MTRPWWIAMVVLLTVGVTACAMSEDPVQEGRWRVAGDDVRDARAVI
jgi:hypothetical protein